jgi:site-specific recombinase XerD
LQKWAHTSITSKEQAKNVLARMVAAVRNGTFDKRGEHPDAVGNSATFSAFLDEYRAQHVVADKLRSNSVDAYLGVFRAKFGDEMLGTLAKSPSKFETWLNECREQRKWESATYARYIEFGRAMFNWAKRRKIVPENPFDVLKAPRGTNERRNRITQEQEEKLLDACDGLDEPTKSKLVKVTPEMVSAVRQRAEAGELQKDIAASMGLSRPLVSQIVNGRVWNPKTRRRSIGREMRRRVIAALDLGVRAGEMLRIQVKHVDYTDWVVTLPATITKAGATTGKSQQVYAGTARIREVLETRRFLGPDAFVFGREDGRFVGDFEKSWNRLFKLSGLHVGRKNGYVWHDLRHEFCSNLIEQGAKIHEARMMARHSDIRTTATYVHPMDERLRELAAKLDRRG